MAAKYLAVAVLLRGSCSLSRTAAAQGGVGAAVLGPVLPAALVYCSLALGLLSARAAKQLLRGCRGYCSVAATLLACAHANPSVCASVLLVDSPLLAAAASCVPPPQTLLLLLLHPA